MPAALVLFQPGHDAVCGGQPERVATCQHNGISLIDQIRGLEQVSFND